MNFIPELPMLAAFSVAAFLLALTPGPDMTLAVAKALSEGRKGGAMVVFGTSIGIVFHTCLVAFGVSALIVASPAAFTLLKTGGAAYLVYLAIQALRHGSSLSVKRTGEPASTMPGNFIRGLWINLVNPKVIIFFMTFLPQFVSSTDGNITGKLIFLGLWMILIGMPVNLAFVLAAERLAGWLQQNPKILRGLDFTIAGVFSLFAVRILMVGQY